MTVLLSQVQRTLGDAYVVERELGGGGMSHVFVARDQALGRRVVVKILQPELAEGISVERFRREIQVAVALQHPHIVPVLSAGESEGLPYFIMPFVEGESLRSRLAFGPMSIPEVVRILRDVARALAHAHAQGIVHRDIKPENVLLTSGAAVVADFGVAKALSSAMRPDRTGSTASHTITIAGTSLGTPRYMAPEQATADPNTDHRADLYAFGVMAYEMITGTPPFTHLTPHELLAAHLTEKPTPIGVQRATVPTALASLVAKCLEKSPAKRPQTAHEITEALEDPAVVSGSFASSSEIRTAIAPARSRGVVIGVAAGAVIALALMLWQSTRPPATGGLQSPAVVAASPRPSIAILPFVNIGRDSGDAYLADGLTEEVTNALGALRGVRVVPRTLAVTARVAESALDSIGQRLGVTSVLEGTLQRSENRLRVTARLVNTADGSMVWSDVFDADLTDVFAVQREISRSIADALGRELAEHSDSLVATPVAAPARTEPTPDAYADYLKGRFLFQQRGSEGLLKSIASFERAIAQDPSYAASHAGLAQALSQLPHYESALSDASWTAAIAHANQAIGIDSSLGIAWAARGAARMGRWQWADAESDLRRATALTPNDASPYQWLGELLLVLRRPADAVKSLRRAAEVDPSSPVIAGSLAYALAIAGDTAGAVAAGVAAVAKAPDLWLTHFMLAASYISAERMPEAVRELERTARLPGGSAPMVVGMLGYAYAQSGDRARATTILKELEQGAARGRYTVPVARVALGLGDTTKALDWLERGVAQHDNSYSEEPLGSSIYDPLRGSARFTTVVRQIGLDPALASRVTR